MRRFVFKTVLITDALKKRNGEMYNNEAGDLDQDSVPINGSPFSSKASNRWICVVGDPLGLDNVEDNIRNRTASPRALRNGIR